MNLHMYANIFLLLTVASFAAAAEEAASGGGSGRRLVRGSDSGGSGSGGSDSGGSDSGGSSSAIGGSSGGYASNPVVISAHDCGQELEGKMFIVTDPFTCGGKATCGGILNNTGLCLPPDAMLDCGGHDISFDYTKGLDYGVAMQDGSKIVDCPLRGQSAAFGIRVLANAGATIRGCVVTDFIHAGIYTESGSATVIEGTTVSNNRRGINAEGETTMFDVEANDNRGYGINAYKKTTMERVTANNNRCGSADPCSEDFKFGVRTWGEAALNDVTANGNDGYGFYFSGAGPFNMTDVTACGNKWDDLHIDDSDAETMGHGEVTCGLSNVKGTCAADCA